MKRIFFLGLILTILGFAWLSTIIFNVEWYIEHMRDGAMVLCILSSMAMGFGGFIMILSQFENR